MKTTHGPQQSARLARTWQRFQGALLRQCSGARNGFGAMKRWTPEEKWRPWRWPFHIAHARPIPIEISPQPLPRTSRFKARGR